MSAESWALAVGGIRLPSDLYRAPIKLTLPYPPSVNAAYRSLVIRGRGMVLLTKEARQFKDIVAKLAALAVKTPLEGPIRLEYRLFRPRKIGDLDNVTKLLFDALEGLCFVNDSQIVEIHAYRFDDKLNPRVEVTICPATSPSG